MTTRNVLTTFAQKVRALRLQKAWSQEELGNRAGLHRTYIGSIERHERNLTLTNAEKIAKALGVDIKDLL